VATFVMENRAEFERLPLHGLQAMMTYSKPKVAKLSKVFF
jgi:hypothetical protein